MDQSLLKLIAQEKANFAGAKLLGNIMNGKEKKAKEQKKSAGKRSKDQIRKLVLGRAMSHFCRVWLDITDKDDIVAYKKNNDMCAKFGEKQIMDFYHSRNKKPEKRKKTPQKSSPSPKKRAKVEKKSRVLQEDEDSADDGSSDISNNDWDEDDGNEDDGNESDESDDLSAEDILKIRKVLAKHDKKRAR